MKSFLCTCAFAALPFVSHAQLWNSDPLPPAWDGEYLVDSYFVPSGPGSGGLSEFDMDAGFDFSLTELDPGPIGIDEAGGWTDASNFAFLWGPADTIRITFLGNTSNRINDFGMNLGGSHVSGSGAYTLWETITADHPGPGSQAGFLQNAAGPMVIDFWANSNDAAKGGTYSMFYPGTSDPTNTGLPIYDFSAVGRVFNVFDDGTGTPRLILVIAIDGWRDDGQDFTDLFVAVESEERLIAPQTVPEPSTYGLVGALLLLGLASVRRSNRAST